MKHAFYSLAAMVSLVLFSPCAAEAVEISPRDSGVRYVGRFDLADEAGPRCTWPASTVAFTVSGGSASVRLKDSGKNFWQIVVNGQAAGVLTLQAGEQTYPVAKDLPAGKHTIELVKRTESFVGVTQVLGVVIADDAKLLPASERARRIEVIGDSISCGYGNEAPRKEEKFSAATENAWLAYGAVAARAVNADYVCVAWSGKKLWPDNSIVDLYGRALATSDKPAWDFARWAPDVVVVNLGTNDFNAKANPDEAGWVAAYVEFIKEIRGRYPKAPVYCAVGTMMSDWPESRKPRTVILGYLEQVIAQANAAGGSPVRLLDFGVQKQANGIGADWHPSAKTHALMGAQLAETLRKDLGW